MHTALFPPLPFSLFPPVLREAPGIAVIVNAGCRKCRPHAPRRLSVWLGKHFFFPPIYQRIGGVFKSKEGTFTAGLTGGDCFVCVWFNMTRCRPRSVTSLLFGDPSREALWTTVYPFFRASFFRPFGLYIRVCGNSHSMRQKYGTPRSMFFLCSLGASIIA